MPIAPKDKAFLDIKLVQECMDAHAKRVSIAFDLWKVENQITLDHMGYHDELKYYNGDDLYNKFIESITK